MAWTQIKYANFTLTFLFFSLSVLLGYAAFCNVFKIKMHK